ncbi:hypothetical protein DV735_g488, partial [Chaetothyriales sp. CBS 134920]
MISVTKTLGSGTGLGHNEMAHRPSTRHTEASTHRLSSEPVMSMFAQNFFDYQIEIIAWRWREEGLSDIENDRDIRARSWQASVPLREFRNVTHPAISGASVGGGNPYRFDSPDAVGDFVAERRRKRRKLVSDDAVFNDGLRNWLRTVDSVPFSASSISEASHERGIQDTSSTTPTSADDIPQNSQATAAGRKRGEEKKAEKKAVHTLRSRIQPLAYPVIYSKVVVQSLTPNIPIPLTHMIKILVEGWKAEGNWPPPNSQPALAAAAAAAAARTKAGRSARFLRWKRERDSARS